MGKKDKVIGINPSVIEQIKEDLDKKDGVCTYEFNKAPQIFIDKGLIHPDVAAKCTSITIATSGCEAYGRNYMFIAGCRVDSENGSIVTDIDPIVMVADLESWTPAPSGCIKFHGNFEGRTEKERIPMAESLDVAVSTLRKNIKGYKKPFKDAPIRFTHTMHFMAKYYRNKIS
ncbi:MAG: hypothetical protein RQ824_10005 [bacterium]|nr:hypothetical protein [bacterium]